MKVHVITGANMSDDVFTTDSRIFGIEISWNVTKLRRAAEVGAFGGPRRFPMSILPPLSDEARGNIDWPKVHGLIERYGKDGKCSGPLAEAAICVCVAIGDETEYRIPVDGNHRMMAWREMGFDHWTSYVVPSSTEASFRVTGLV